MNDTTEARTRARSLGKGFPWNSDDRTNVPLRFSRFPRTAEKLLVGNDVFDTLFTVPMSRSDGFFSAEV